MAVDAYSGVKLAVVLPAGITQFTPSKRQGNPLAVKFGQLFTQTAILLLVWINPTRWIKKYMWSQFYCCTWFGSRCRLRWLIVRLRLQVHRSWVRWILRWRGRAWRCRWRRCSFWGSWGGWVLRTGYFVVWRVIGTCLLVCWKVHMFCTFLIISIIVDLFKRYIAIRVYTTCRITLRLSSFS